MNAQHLTTDELADAAEGLLDPARAAFAESHLAGCPDCHAQSDALRAVTATLQAEPPRSMPEAVAHRLNDVVAAQQVQRADASVMGSGRESVASRQRRATLGTFGEDLEKARPRWALGALAAAAVAAVVGFSTYVISASAGLNEPPVVAAVNGRDLGADARALEQASGGLSPHRFSQAWDCARRVTDGRITGLAASSLDGTPALLVYTESDGSMQVIVVTGCGADTPSAGPSALLPR
jgi:anti-sigma factor RsiW